MVVLSRCGLQGSPRWKAMVERPWNQSIPSESRSDDWHCDCGGWRLNVTACDRGALIPVIFSLPNFAAGFLPNRVSARVLLA